MAFERTMDELIKRPLNNLSNEEREKLCKKYHYLVGMTASKLCNNPEWYDDAYSAAGLGLWIAALCWDQNREASFKTYAIGEMRYKVMDEMFYRRREGKPVYYAEDFRTKLYKYDSIMRELEQTPELHITNETRIQIAKECDIPEDLLIGYVCPTVSLQSSFGSDGDESLSMSDIIADPESFQAIEDKIVLDIAIQLIREIGATVSSTNANLTKWFQIRLNAMMDELEESLHPGTVKAYKNLDPSNPPKKFSVLDMIREDYPELVANKSDAPEVRKQKERLLDNKYQAFNSMWRNNIKKVILPIIHQCFAEA